MVAHGPMEGWLEEVIITTGNRSYMIRISKTGWGVRKNSKHIKATPITGKQYLKDQINKKTADPINEILKNYEKLPQENVSNNHDSQGGEDTYMNNNNNTHHSNMQEYIVNRIPTSCEQEENQKPIPINKNIGKLDDRTNTWTHYGRISRKPDRFNIQLIYNLSILS